MSELYLDCCCCSSKKKKKKKEKLKNDYSVGEKQAVNVDKKKRNK